MYVLEKLLIKKHSLIQTFVSLDKAAALDTEEGKRYLRCLTQLVITTMQVKEEQK